MSDSIQNFIERYRPALLDYMTGGNGRGVPVKQLAHEASEMGFTIADMAAMFKAAMPHPATVLEAKKFSNRMFDLFAESAEALMQTRLETVVDECQRDRSTLELRNQQLTDLHKAGIAIASCLEFEQILQQVSQRINQLLAGDVCSISVWDQENDTVVWVSDHDPNGYWQSLPSPSSVYPLAEYPLTKFVLVEGVPQQIGLSQPEADPAEIAYLKSIQAKTLLILPLLFKGQAIGIVEVVCFSQEITFSDYKVSMAQLLANQAAAAVENSHLYEQAQREIAKRARIEANLRDEQSFAAAILDTTNAFVIVLDSDLRIVRFNRTCQQLTGYSYDEVADSYMADIFLMPQEKEPVAALLKQLGPNQIYNTNDNYWLTKSGEPCLISWSNSAMLNADGQVDYIISVGVDITQRRDMEEELRASQELFGQVVQSISDHIYVTEVTKDGQLRNRYISPNVEELTGYPLERLMGAWSFWPSVMIHPEDRATANAQFEQLRSGKSGVVEYRIIRADGSVIWVRDSGRVEVEGESTYIYGVVGDITHRKQRELEIEAIATLATSLRAAVTPDEMFPLILDPIFDLLQVEGAILEIYQPDTEEIVIKSARGAWEDAIGMVTPAGQGISPGILDSQKIYINDNIFNDERLYKLVDTKGLVGVVAIPLVAQTQKLGIIWVGRHDSVSDDIVRLLIAMSDIAANALYRANLFEQLQESNAELVRLTTALEDIIKARTADLEEALTEASEARDKIDAILRSIGDGVIVTDLENKVILVNPAAEEILGFKQTDMVGKEIGIGIKNDQLRHIVRGTLNQFISGYETETELVDPRDGKQKVMRAHTSLVDDHESHPLGTVTIIQDVTAVREVNRLKTEFLTTAAHEFRTPLTSVQGFSEILLTRDLEKDRQHQYLRMINKQATHLAEIVNDLLDVARLEAKRGLEIKPKPLNIADLLEEVLLPFIETERQHDFHLVEMDHLPRVVGDPFRIAQVAKNLISNAIKYSPNGGKVTIMGQVTGDTVTISVHDEGIGMTPEQQEHLFEKFYRADASNTSISGTGLGLAICKLIVELHDGEIWAESEYGAGSTLYFTIPVVTEKSAI